MSIEMTLGHVNVTSNNVLIKNYNASTNNKQKYQLILTHSLTHDNLYMIEDPIHSHLAVLYVFYLLCFDYDIHGHMAHHVILVFFLIQIHNYNVSNY